MSWMPFVCLGIGFFIGVIVKNQYLLKLIDNVFTLALALLMLSIGVGIGLDETILNSMLKIGFHCFVIAIFAIAGSVLLTVLCEKTVLPLKKIDADLSARNIKLDSKSDHESGSGGKFIVWIMPICIVMGLLIGVFLRNKVTSDAVNSSFTIFLVVLYICVGVSQGSNREVFQFIKILGIRVIWLSFAILVGSLAGGYIAGFLLNIPENISVISAGGMSYYSITGAFMTKTYGLEIGTYGFIVNVIREFMTVLLMPLLIKISMGSPIAGGASGNMDTMLAPVTKFVGVRLGLVTLVTGAILTFIVPFLLPALSALFL